MLCTTSGALYVVQVQDQRPAGVAPIHSRKPRSGGPAIHVSGLLTQQRYDELLDEQGGCCGICGRERQARRRLAVDHDHTTGQVRGLLCSNCNVGLGLFQDSVDLLEQAIGYLLDARIRREIAVEQAGASSGAPT